MAICGAVYAGEGLAALPDVVGEFVAAGVFDAALSPLLQAAAMTVSVATKRTTIRHCQLRLPIFLVRARIVALLM
jgi:hypothetical protein